MKNQEKNVLIISPFFRPNIGGAEAHLDDLCEYLRKNEFNVSVLTYQPLTTRAKGEKKEIKDCLEIRRISWFGHNWFHKLEPYVVLEFFYLTPRLFFGALFYLLDNGDKVDLVYAYGLTAAIITKFINWIFRKPVVSGTCAVYNFKTETLKSKLIYWILKDFNKILPLAEVSKRDLMNTGLSDKKMQVYNLWVEPFRFPEKTREECKKAVGLADRFIVLFVGRLIEIKGIRVIISAAKEVNKKINFVIVGDGPLADDLRKECKSFSNIHFVGRVSEEYLNLYYRSSDIFVIPSQYEECFGKVIIEALYCGTPVIGSNKGAIPDVISEKVGRVIEPSAENFKLEIEYLYQNQGILNEMKERTREYVLDNYSIKNAEEIAEVFKECIHEKIQSC